MHAGGSMVTYRSGEDTVQAYLALPAGAGKHPALMMIHEWWGLTDWIRQQADTLAQRGYVVLALDLYRGKVASTPDLAHELSRALPEDRVERDLDAAAKFLYSRGDVDRRRIASIGWCMGGGYSLMAAMEVKHLAACVVCYGRLVTGEKEIKSISCPILGIFGGLDRGITPESVKAFESAAKKQGKDVTTVIYDDAGHAFMNPGNAGGYKEQDTKEAQEKIFAFLDKHLIKH